VSRRAHAIAVVGAGLVGLGCARRAPPPRRHDVAMRNFGFEPAVLTVGVGDTISWTNHDVVPHTATARDSLWDSQSIAPDGTWRLVARRPGTYTYLCVFHPTMRGTIEVR